VYTFQHSLYKYFQDAYLNICSACCATRLLYQPTHSTCRVNSMLCHGLPISLATGLTLQSYNNWSSWT